MMACAVGRSSSPQPPGLLRPPVLTPKPKVRRQEEPGHLSNNHNSSKIHYISSELLTTELTYMRELQTVVDNYIRPFEDVENQKMIPSDIRGRTQLIFGNIREIHEFHQKYIVGEILSSDENDCAIKLCQCIVKQKFRFFELYLQYCQNKRNTEEKRAKHERDKFFLQCQHRARHALPLSAYLLKPVQRITKYQLLIKDLEQHCTERQRATVECAKKTMLELLSRLNQSMLHVFIAKYPGELTLLGRFRISNECDVYVFNRSNYKVKKSQIRHLFLFEDALLMCKKRDKPPREFENVKEHYEFKLSITMSQLQFAPCSKTGTGRFEVWNQAESVGYAISIRSPDERARKKWIEKLDKIMTRLQEAANANSSANVSITTNLKRNCSGLSSNYNYCVDRYQNAHGLSCPASPASTLISDTPATPQLSRTFFGFGSRRYYSPGYPSSSRLN